jgi:hypothetical protein
MVSIPIFSQMSDISLPGNVKNVTQLILDDFLNKDSLCSFDENPTRVSRTCPSLNTRSSGNF